MYVVGEKLKKLEPLSTVLCSFTDSSNFDDEFTFQAAQDDFTFQPAQLTPMATDAQLVPSTDQSNLAGFSFTSEHVM